ncbi:hypothetical protein [Nocardioides sp.]
MGPRPTGPGAALLRVRDRAECAAAYEDVLSDLRAATAAVG